jgi:hypothetical protein
MVEGGRRMGSGRKEGAGNERKNKEQTLPLMQRGGADVF